MLLEAAEVAVGGGLVEEWASVHLLEQLFPSKVQMNPLLRSVLIHHHQTDDAVRLAARSLHHRAEPNRDRSWKRCLFLALVLTEGLVCSSLISSNLRHCPWTRVARTPRSAYRWAVTMFYDFLPGPLQDFIDSALFFPQRPSGRARPTLTLSQGASV